MYDLLLSAAGKSSHYDVLAPAVYKWSFDHGLGLLAKSHQSISCTSSHVHRWCLLACPNEETLLVLISLFVACWSHYILMVVRVNELNRFLFLFCYWFSTILLIGLASVGSAGLLTFIGLAIPYEVEPDKGRVSIIRVIVGSRGLRWEHHVVENLVLSGTSVSFVT